MEDGSILPIRCPERSEGSCRRLERPGQVIGLSFGAIQNFGGYFGGAFAPLLTGVIADATGSYAPSFVIGGIIAALAAVAYTVLVREPIKDKTAAAQTESRTDA